MAIRYVSVTKLTEHLLVHSSSEELFQQAIVGMVTVTQEITKTQVVYFKQRGTQRGLGESLWLGSTSWWGTNVLHLTERQKDSPGQGRNHFYTTGVWRMWWCHTTYSIYLGFSMMCLTSRPGQQLLAGNCQTMLFWPVTAKLEASKDHNQGRWPWLLKLQCFRCTKVRAYYFTITYMFTKGSHVTTTHDA